MSLTRALEEEFARTDAHVEGLSRRLRAAEVRIADLTARCVRAEGDLRHALGEGRSWRDLAESRGRKIDELQGALEEQARMLGAKLHEVAALQERNDTQADTIGEYMAKVEALAADKARLARYRPLLDRVCEDNARLCRLANALAILGRAAAGPGPVAATIAAFTG
jgi:chromosome segregation ATPase